MENIYPKQIGTLVELQCITRLSEIGCVISMPIGDFARYDFIVEVKNHLYKVQCKSWTYGKALNTICLKTSSSHLSKGEGAMKKRYTKEEIDFFATFYLGECYLVPIAECQGYSKVIDIEQKQSGKPFLAQYCCYTQLKIPQGETIYQKVADKRWIKKERYVRRCLICGKLIQGTDTKCNKCKRYEEQEKRKPSKESLQELLATKSLAFIQNLFHIDRRMLEQWLLSFDIKREDFIKKGRKVLGCYRFSLDGELEKEYEDYYDVEKDGFSKKSVQKCCLHYRKTYKGKKWEYKRHIAGECNGSIRPS